MTFNSIEIPVFFSALLANIALFLVVGKYAIKGISKTFFCFFLAAQILWISSNFSLFSVYNHSVFLWLTRITVLFAVIHEYAFFLFIYVFLSDRKVLHSRPVIITGALCFLAAIATLTPYMWTGVEVGTNGLLAPTTGPAVAVFGLSTFVCVAETFYWLVKKYRAAQGLQRLQWRYMAIGVVFTFVLITLFSLSNFLFFHDISTTRLGHLYTLPFVLFASYAIVQHGLLNIKVVASASLVFALVTINVLELVFADGFWAIIMRLGILCITGIFGLLLIKSVRREIAQKEKLSELATSLEKANEQLKELDRQKTDFLSIAAHQLRTPLSIINGYVELIKEGAYGKVHKQTKNILDNIDQSNGHLIKLVDEFLDITRIEQGRTKYDIKPHNLGELVDGVVGELKDRAEQHGLKIVWKKPTEEMVVPMDDEKVRHVVFNFVDNAIKYSLKGKITVLIRRENDGMAVLVQDQGFGFGPVDQPNFFQKFYRGVNVRGTNVNGTGLGLYVCKKFIDAHGGRIWASSPGLGKGSEFGCWLPCNVTSPITEKVVMVPALKTV